MRRTTLLGIMVSVLVAGTGCKSSCGERHGLFGRSSHSETTAKPTSGPKDLANGCCEGYPASSKRPGSYVPGMAMPGSAGWIPEGAYGTPIYPSGSPIPVRPGTVGPSNELPYPTIPAPGVPENPAQPMPAIPSATSLPVPAARTTADPKLPK